MGNDHSVLSEYHIEESPYAQIGLWTLHDAEKKSIKNVSTSTDPERVTVFTGKLKNYGKPSKEFERAIESLKTIRHPTVLKYHTSCLAGDTIHLFVENVAPLAQVLHQQSELEICSGLQNILVALDFLHTKTGRVHNNVCRDSVFVTKAGEWKLGCFDLSCSFSEVNQGFLDQTRSSRYDKSIPPEDESKLPKTMSASSVSSRDVYGYGQLVKETIKKCLDSNVSDAHIFSELASKQMQNPSPQSRPKASTLAKHPFFNQPLLMAQDFLSQIAIKNPAEKEEFFKKLPKLLYTMPEDVVGSKLAKTLLSRMVVLNTSAQIHLLPHLLIPRTESNDQGIFDVGNYAKFILPVVTRIFPVRDAQIRLLLLQYFPHFMGLIERDELTQIVLPELLLGIKDTDDAVVSGTLRSLAELVPILGGATVIGGTRLKLFTNGAPKTQIMNIPPIISNNKIGRKSSVLVAATAAVALPERHEPDGGEDDSEKLMANVIGTEEGDEDADHWSDWEAEDEPIANQEFVPIKSSLLDLAPISPIATAIEPARSGPTPGKTPVVRRSVLEDDLSALEIQIKPKSDDIDYFADMEPTITAAASAVAPLVASSNKDSPATNSLSFNVDENKEADDGWNWDD